MTLVRGEQRAAVRQLTAARRRNRGVERDFLEAWYELWMRGFFAIVVIVAVTTLLRGDALSARSLLTFREHAAGVVSVVLAAAVWVALRAGARGAPLAPEAADVRYLLLAPIPRATVLRPIAWRQLRSSVAVGAVVGFASGIGAAARLPAGPGSWSLAGCAAGVLVAALLWGVVAGASARRCPRRVATLIGLLVVGLAVVDATKHTWISPTSWIAAVALLPLRGLVPPLAAAGGVVAAVALPAIALLAIGGTSLEPLLGRSALVSQLRFAASLQDVRTVVLLHRELAREGSRSRPWLRLPSPAKIRRPAWRRGWHGYLRWPAARVTRMLVLVAGAVSLAFAARSTPLLLVAAGLASFVAAVDVVEPFASELDHPSAILTYGVSIRSVLLRNLAAPIVVFVAIGLAIAGAAGALGNAPAALAPACAVSASLAALAAAALNVALGPPPASEMVTAMLFPEIGGMVLIIRQALPPAIAIGGLAPIVVAAQTTADGPAIALAAGVAVVSTAAIAFSALRGVG